MQIDSKKSTNLVKIRIMVVLHFYLFIGNQIGDRNIRRNSRNLWKVIGRSHYRRGESGKLSH